MALVVWFAAASAWAVQPADQLLPDTTKGFLSIPDLAKLESDFRSTQLGQLTNDELMRPFVEDLKRQIREGGSRRLERLGVTFDDFRGVVGGEIALAMIQPAENAAGVVAIVDVTGHEREARALLDRVAENLTKQGGRRLRAATDTSVGLFELPRREGERQGRQSASFLTGSLLCIGDNVRVVEAVLRATTVEPKNNLASLVAYRESMAGASKAAGQEAKPPHIRWFIEPFGYAECIRLLDPPKEKPNPDVLKVLRRQGFTAVQGLGGHVTFADRYEISHRTKIYAPPVAQKQPTTDDKYMLGARMLDFPNSENLEAEPWVPRDVATYNTWNWNIPKAFAASKTLVDEWIDSPGEGVFQTVLDDMRDSREGPRVDLEKDLVGNLGNRISLITDYQMPIGPRSERWLAGVKCTDAKAVAVALEKSLKTDPVVRRRELQGFTVWEITEQQQTQTSALIIEVPGGGVHHADLDASEYEQVAFQPGKSRFNRKSKRLQKQQQQHRVIQNLALTVAHDHLFVASHMELLERVLKQAGIARSAGGAASDPLAAAPDYRRVVEVTHSLGSQAIAARLFSRTDEALRTNYELFRKNEMPKSQSIMGKLLNEVLGDNKPGAVRRARLDGSKLPPYESVRRFLGPAGTFVVTQDDGWLVTGFMLNKEQAATSAQ
jgi:hypothetical protein